MSLWYWVSLLVFITIFKSKLGYSDDVPFQEDRLIHHLLENYNPIGRPLKNFKDVVNINCTFALIEIINVDDKSKEAEFLMWLSLLWKDEKLVWNSSEFGNIKTLRIPENKIWIPDIILYNSVDARRSTLQNACFLSNTVVGSNGDVIYVPSCNFKISFKDQFQYYPYDELKLELKFGSWTLSSLEIRLHLLQYANELDFSDYRENGDWLLKKSQLKKESKSYPCCPEEYESIEVNMVLKRRPHFYSITLVLQSVLSFLIILFMFTISPENGSRIIILAINMTVITLQALFLVHHIPSMTTIPIIVKCTAILAVLNVIAIGFFSILYTIAGYTSTKVSPCLSAFVDLLGRFLCMNPTPSENIPFIYKRANFDSLCDDKIIPGSTDEKDRMLTNLSQWYLVAVILNRFAFIIYVLIVVLTMLSLFL